MPLIIPHAPPPPASSSPGAAPPGPRASDGGALPPRACPIREPHKPRQPNSICQYCPIISLSRKHKNLPENSICRFLFRKSQKYAFEYAPPRPARQKVHVSAPPVWLCSAPPGAVRHQSVAARPRTGVSCAPIRDTFPPRLAARCALLRLSGRPACPTDFCDMELPTVGLQPRASFAKFTMICLANSVKYCILFDRHTTMLHISSTLIPFPFPFTSIICKGLSTIS